MERTLLLDQGELMKLKALTVTMIAMSITSVAVAKGENKMKGTLAKTVELSKEKKVIKPLFSESFKVMGIGLSKGQKLETHQTPTPAFLYVQSGQVLFTMNGEKTVLAAGDYFLIPAKEMHEVEAQSDSLLMLSK